MTGITTCSPRELRERLEGEGCVLVDVRPFPEFASGHVEGSRLVPLEALKERPDMLAGEEEVVLVCRTGRRAAEAAAILQAAGRERVAVLEGGMEAWRRAGEPVRRQKGPIALERQVRIVAGALVLIGLLTPGLGFLPYLIGAGLIFAGATDSCMMGMLLARLPWNRSPGAEKAAAHR